MRAAFGRVDVVREAVRRLRVRVVPLQRDLDDDAVALARHEDRLLVDGRLVLVQELDELADAAFVQERVAACPSRSSSIVIVTPAFRNASSRSRCESVSKLKSVVSKTSRIGLERDLRAALFGRAGHVEVAGRLAALVPLLVHVAVAPDLELEPLGQRVDDRDADAVQTAGDLVRGVLELAAGVQHRQHDFRRRPAALVHVHRNAAAVVDDRDRPVDVNRDVDVAAEAGQRFVDRVVDDLVHEVVQTRRTGRPDVHRRPLADGFEAFEDFDFVGAVVVRSAGRNSARRGECPGSDVSNRSLTSVDSRSPQIRIGMITYVYS